MELTETIRIGAPRAVVWAALNDAEVLRACIPGCSELTGSPEEGFAATVTQKVGPVKARFRGAVTLDDIVAPESYRISGEGSGGAAGFAKGSAHVALADLGPDTELTYVVEARIGGKLAQLGSRLIDGFARKMAANFFESLKAQLEPPAGG